MAPASALDWALEMPQHERQRRMRALRRVVAGRNVFSWASDILEGLETHRPGVRLKPPGTQATARGDARVVPLSSAIKRRPSH